jgi:hypothetical protein
MENLTNNKNKHMETKTKKVIVKDQGVDGFISQAIAQSLPVETMEKLFALREKVKAEKAREMFVESLSKFQEECPKIEKKKKVMNKDGQTVRYQYAPLDVIIEQIKKPLAKYGFSYTWNVKNETGFITAIATITHALGHFQTSEFQIPIDMEGYMTAPQKYASALTFAKRYSLCNALGIATADEDTDAVDVNKEKNPKSIKSKIVFALKALGEDTSSKLSCDTAILKLTQLRISDENLDEILGRLNVIIDEQNNENS